MSISARNFQKDVSALIDSYCLQMFMKIRKPNRQTAVCSVKPDKQINDWQNIRIVDGLWKITNDKEYKWNASFFCDNNNESEHLLGLQMYW